MTKLICEAAENPSTPYSTCLFPVSLTTTKHLSLLYPSCLSVQRKTEFLTIAWNRTLAEYRKDNVQLMSAQTDYCRSSVASVSGSYCKASTSPEMASKTLFWADTSRNLHRLMRGIRLWHSRGLVQTQKLQQIVKRLFVRVLYAYKKCSYKKCLLKTCPCITKNLLT